MGLRVCWPRLSPSITPVSYPAQSARVEQGTDTTCDRREFLTNVLCAEKNFDRVERRNVRIGIVMGFFRGLRRVSVILVILCLSSRQVEVGFTVCGMLHLRFVECLDLPFAKHMAEFFFFAVDCLFQAIHFRAIFI